MRLHICLRYISLQTQKHFVSINLPSIFTFQMFFFFFLRRGGGSYEIWLVDMLNRLPSLNDKVLQLRSVSNSDNIDLTALNQNATETSEVVPKL